VKTDRQKQSEENAEKKRGATSHDLCMFGQHDRHLTARGGIDTGFVIFHLRREHRVAKRYPIVWVPS
jgi:hypothetical protein